MARLSPRWVQYGQPQRPGDETDEKGSTVSCLSDKHRNGRDSPGSLHISFHPRTPFQSSSSEHALPKPSPSLSLHPAKPALNRLPFQLTSALAEGIPHADGLLDKLLALIYSKHNLLQASRRHLFLPEDLTASCLSLPFSRSSRD